MPRPSMLDILLGGVTLAVEEKGLLTGAFCGLLLASGKPGVALAGETRRGLSPKPLDLGLPPGPGMPPGFESGLRKGGVALGGACLERLFLVGREPADLDGEGNPLTASKAFEGVGAWEVERVVGRGTRGEGNRGDAFSCPSTCKMCSYM